MNHFLKGESLTTSAADPYVPGSGTYTETVTYHWARALVGQVITFTCELDGDLWRHRASFTADGEPFAIDEVWRRIKVNEPAK